MSHHHAEAQARLVIGIIGNIISFGLFLSPWPTFRRMYQKKSIEGFHPYPYLATVMNCLFWIWYGVPVVHPDSTLVITINSIGLALELFYLSIFFYYDKESKYRKKIFLVLFGEIVLYVAIILITLLTLHTHEKRSMAVGIICVVFGAIMYGSPLSVVFKVIKTKSVEFLPFWLCLAGFLNGITWFIYAFLKVFDPYIASGNGLGALFGLTQLLIYAYYSTCGKPAQEKKPSEVQLENVAADKMSPV